MNKELEAFVNDVRKAIKSMPSRPSITLKNANVVGIKLNSKSLKQLENEAQTSDISNLNSLEYPMGVRIYKDESVDVPRYIVEGEIELDNAKPSEALECLEEIENYCEWSEFNSCLSHDFPKEYNTIKQVLIKAQENEKVLEIIKKNQVSTFWINECKSVEEYNGVYGRKLTQEEFDLLKRWLG